MYSQTCEYLEGHTKSGTSYQKYLLSVLANMVYVSYPTYMGGIFANFAKEPLITKLCNVTYGKNCQFFGIRENKPTTSCF